MRGGEDEDRPDIEGLLQEEADRPVPEPSRDLIQTTLARVRNWILVGDLLRLVTLEGLWKSANDDDDGASEQRERQDP